MRLLLCDPRVDPSDNNNEAIKRACANGSLSIVKELLKRPQTDPAANNNSALNYATRGQHKEIVSLLMRDERVLVQKRALGELN